MTEQCIKGNHAHKVGVGRAAGEQIQCSNIYRVSCLKTSAFKLNGSQNTSSKKRIGLLETPHRPINLLQGGCEHSALELLNTALAAALADWKNEQVFPLKVLENSHPVLEPIPARC